MNTHRIAVVGGTGAQGSGLVRAILADPSRRFEAVVLTRSPDGAAARASAQAGAKLVTANLDDRASLVAAFAGVHGVYAVTNFWEHHSPERELRQAENLAQAAAQAGVKHLIWSTLEDTREFVPLTDTRMPTLMERYKVPHFDAKGEANAFFTAARVPTTFLYTSFYWDNLIHFGMGPQRNAEGQLVFALPIGSRVLPGIAASDIGACAFGVFARGDSMIGQSVGIAGEHLTGDEMAEALGRRLGEPVQYRSIPFAEYAAYGFPGADDLANMFQFKHDFNDAFVARRDIAHARELNPGLLDFAGWLKRDGAALMRSPEAAS